MNGNIQYGALIALAGVASASASAILIRYRTNPVKRERQRRLTVAQRGRFGEGTLTDVSEGLLHYSYTVGGVQYITSQDISRLSEYVPADVDRLVGPVRLKYFPRNPANSIIVAETWSGLRTFVRQHSELEC